jgi:predicted O-methyltransferase YrrM
MSLLIQPLPADLEAHVLAHYNLINEGWCWPEKAIKLAEIVWSVRPNLTVEVGVFGGRSFIPMAAVVAHLESGSTAALPSHEAHGIDPWLATAAVKDNEGTEHVPFWSNQSMLDGVYNRASQAVERLQSRVVRLFRETSEQAFGRYPKGSIGVLSLDGNHAEPQAFADVQRWWPKLQVGGVFIMDDTSWASQKKAVDWLRERGDVVWQYDQDGNSCIFFEKKRD